VCEREREREREKEKEKEKEREREKDARHEFRVTRCTFIAQEKDPS
jgi:hypothetical protein